MSKTYYAPMSLEQISATAYGVELATIKTPGVVGYLFVYDDEQRARAEHPGCRIITLRDEGAAEGAADRLGDLTGHCSTCETGGFPCAKCEALWERAPGVSAGGDGSDAEGQRQ
jgi:hypothetical protein